MIETRHEMYGDESRLLSRKQKRLTYCHGCGRLFLSERMLVAMCASGGLLCYLCSKGQCKKCGRSACKQHSHEVNEEEIMCQRCWEEDQRQMLVTIACCILLTIVVAVVLSISKR